LLRLALRAHKCLLSCVGNGVVSHCPSSNQSRRTAVSPSSVMGPIHWGGPQATRSVVQGCSTAMTPQPVGRDAQVSGPSMHAAATSMARGQRRMVGRSSSMTDRSCSPTQAVQTMMVNGRSVARGDEVNVARPVRLRGDRSHVMSSCRSLLSSGYLEEQHVSAAAARPGQGDDAVSTRPPAWRSSTAVPSRTAPLY
jgi:hypothetical protein